MKLVGKKSGPVIFILLLRFIRKWKVSRVINFLQLEEDSAALEKVLNAAHCNLLATMNQEDREEGTDMIKSAENFTKFCLLLASLKPTKSNHFLYSIQVSST